MDGILLKELDKFPIRLFSGRKLPNYTLAGCSFQGKENYSYIPRICVPYGSQHDPV